MAVRAADAQRVYDAQNNLPLLTEEQLKKLTVLKREVFKTRPGEIREHSYKGKKVTVKDDQFITEASFNYITEQTPKVLPQVDIIVKKSELYLPISAASLIDIYESVCEKDHITGLYGVFDINATNLSGMISLFCIYKDFPNLYESYLDDKDDNVTFTEDAKLMSPSITFNRGPLYEQDIKASVHMLTVTMAKTFSKDIKTRTIQVTEFTSHRLSALNNALMVPESNPNLNMKTLHNLPPIWALVPKLREKIFEWIRSNCQNPEFGTALTILGHASLTNVIAMVNFIARAVTTKAHLLKVIWEETAAFMAVLSKIKEEMGTDWVYFRVLRPGDMRLAIGKFRNLAVAGNQYMLSYFDATKTYHNVVCNVQASIPSLREQVMTQVSSDIFKDQSESAAGNQYLVGAEILGLDLAKISPEGNLKTSIEADRSLDMDDEDEILATLVKKMLLKSKKSSSARKSKSKRPVDSGSDSE